jgi:uncharacterized damage-inducible protein DinB
MKNEFLKRQFEHDIWATEQLVAHLRTLSPEQLELTSDGTYGTIRGTLQHIVVADENYVVRITGKILHETPFRVTDGATLDDIATHLGHVKAGVARLFDGPRLEAERILTDTPLRRPDAPRIEMETWVPAAQFVNHGADHRSHINTILATHGLETIDLQIWPYAMGLGASRQVT